MKKQQISIITLGVSDLQDSLRFYRDCFGWEPSGESTGDIVFFRLKGITLALYPLNALADDATVDASGTGFKGFTLAINTESEQEVDEIILSLRQKDVKIVKEPQKVFWGGYSSYVSDPDGNLWEIAFNPFMEF